MARRRAERLAASAAPRYELEQAFLIPSSRVYRISHGVRSLLARSSVAALVGPQRLDRIDPSRSAGRRQARQYGNHEEKSNGGGEGRRIGRADAVEERGQEPGRRQRGHGADQSAEQGKAKRTSDDEPRHRPSLRAERHTKADLR